MAVLPVQFPVACTEASDVSFSQLYKQLLDAVQVMSEKAES